MAVLSKKMMVRKRVLDDIRSGKLSPGEKLEGDRELSARLSVSRVTLSRGLNELAREGILSRRVGSGTFVRENLPPRMNRITDKLTIGLVMSCVNGPVAINLIEGLHQVYPSEVCDVILKDPAGSPDAERAMVTRLVETDVDAIVVSTSFEEDSPVGRKFYESVAKTIPLVMTDCILKSGGASVSINNYEGGRIVAAALLKHNPDGELFLALKRNLKATTLLPRIEGFNDYFAEKSINTETILLPANNDSLDKVLRKSLAKIRLADGVFLTQGGILPRLLNVMGELGVSTNEINLCAFDDFSGIANAFKIPHVEQPFLEIAKEIASMVDNLRKGGSIGRNTLLTPRLIEPVKNK
jgi:DNA-binding LacI/PurR family transcriptional regulator